MYCNMPTQKRTKKTTKNVFSSFYKMLGITYTSYLVAIMGHLIKEKRSFKIMVVALDLLRGAKMYQFWQHT